jgi:hypothetical protein
MSLQPNHRALGESSEGFFFGFEFTWKTSFGWCDGYNGMLSFHGRVAISLHAGPDWRFTGCWLDRC